ncbi:MAG: acetylxylan esterase, partial [Rhodospirillaceae bacterium]|nr:acetylxylan esterase [Rhodospirillaceae bacterium]
PTYGYGLAELLAVEPPAAPDDLAAFWRGHYDAATRIDPKPRVQRSAFRHPDWQALDLRYTSTDGVPIGGWLLLPRDGPVERALVVGHGYGGREEPDTHLPVDATALLFPCFRGLSRSARPPISQDPNWHVLHDIDRRERYVLRGCVEDLWLAVSVLLALFPWVEGRIGYAGISFGGGIGGLALAWDTRIARGHLSLPTFGHHPLRVTLPTTGSGEAVRRYHAANPDVLDTLAYYDAAAAARHITRPMHIAAACFDPAVPPPGQFAIYNAVAGRKQLFTFSAGHFDYPAAQQEERVLLSQLRGFFAEL